jgi:hypothetical protein
LKRKGSAISKSLREHKAKFKIFWLLEGYGEESHSLFRGVITDFNIMRRISSERPERGSIEEVLPSGRAPDLGGFELSLIFQALEV